MVQESRQSNLFVALVAVTVVGLAAVAWWLWQPVPPRQPVPPTEIVDDADAGEATLASDEFRQAIEAVAATEEGDFQKAVALWAELLEILPDDPDIQINRAVAVLKWIDTIEKELSSGKISPDRQPAVMQELESAYRLAEDATAKLSATQIDDPRVPLIESAVLISKANRLTYPADRDLREQAAQVLMRALEKDPAQPLLVASFNEIVMVLGGDNPELEKKNVEYLFAAWQAMPRNLFLLRRSAETLLENEDPRLRLLLEPSLDVTRPMWSMLQSQIDRIKPEEMIPQVAQAIDAGDWTKTRPLRFWLNIIRGMPGFLSDSRILNPDPLALLDTSFLNRVSGRGAYADLASELPEYRSVTSVEPAEVAIWYDFDFDLQADVVASHGSELQFMQVSADALDIQHRLQVDIVARGILAADFFEVDTPDRPKLPASVAELMLNPVAASDKTLPDGESVRSGSRHDTLQELLVWGDAGIRVIGWQERTDGGFPFQVLPTENGLQELQAVQQIWVADIESDGDLDLLVAAADGLHVMQNNGNRTFQEITQFSSLPDRDVQVTAGFACDFDRDVDQDFVLLTSNASIAVFENILHGQFRFRLLDHPEANSLAAVGGITVADFDSNASWDWLMIGAEGSNLVYTLCPAPGEINASRTLSLPLSGSEIESGDLNNDGLLDLIAAGDQGLQLWSGAQLSLANGDTQPTTKTLAAGLTASSLRVIDRNYNGMLDILAIVDGRPSVWSATGKGDGGFVDVRLAGINDVNGGGRVNHYAVGSVLELWTADGLIPRLVQQPVTHIGLGPQVAENLRVIFPNGLTQNVQEVPSNMLIEEKQMLRGSCPYVYGWDGEKFVLITDLLWNAPLGLQIKRGVTLPDRRWEYLCLPGELVQPRDSGYELRITEELWEVAYFDHVVLTAVDHPAELRLFTNEKVGPPSLAEPRLFTAGHKVYPATARDGYGRDVREQLLQIDREYVQAFAHQICQGLCEPHYIELDFGTLPVNQPLRLFLNGWMYPTDTSLNIGIDQNPQRPLPESPSLWVVDEFGKWVCAQPTMGFPGGKPKSIVVDLDGVFVSDDHRIRIGASQQIYWDEAFVSWDSDDTQMITSELPLLSAKLQYRGFSLMLPREADQPHWFDYQAVVRTPQWSPLSGPFTRFGDVHALLKEDDDRLVVMTGGDEIQLRFGLPDRALPEGWTRDFVLHSVGWDKDADANTLAGQGSLPLPFKNQLAYPPPPEQAAEAEEVWQKNAKTLTRVHVLPMNVAH